MTNGSYSPFNATCSVIRMAAIWLCRGVVDQLLDLVEELEVDAALLQREIQRGDDHISHAGLHLVEERSLVVEEDPHITMKRHSRREIRLRAIASDKAEVPVVDRIDDRRIGAFG